MSEGYQNELSLMDLIQIVLNKIFWIIGVTLIFAFFGYIYGYRILADEFTASSSMIVLVENSNESQSQNFTFGQKLVDTYTTLLLSDLVVNKVQTNLNGGYTDCELRNAISVTGVRDTIIIKLNVKRNSAIEAQEIANEFVDVVSLVAKDFEGFDNIEVLDRATLPRTSSGPNRVLYLLIGTLLGGIISVGMVLVLELVSGTINTAKDAEQKLKLRVIGIIPNYDVEEVIAHDEK